MPPNLGVTQPFGISYGARELERTGQLKQTMAAATGTSPEEDAAAHAMYVRSHGAYAPGEQRRRGYNWEATQVKDPAGHAFGALDKQSEYQDGVKKALQPGLDQTLPVSAAAERE